MKNVIIIGAGASGMIAAINAISGRKDVKVTILEHNIKPGRKLLATGNGRCNLTNKKLNTDCFRSHDGDRLSMWLDRCKTEDVLKFFEELGMLCTDKAGYIYPYSCQASTVNDMLIQTCEEKNIDIITDTHVIDIDIPESGKFLIKTSQGYEDENGQRKKKRLTFDADRVVLACGSKAYSSLGSDGSGYGIAKNLGLKMIPVVPALTGLRCKERICGMAAGVRMQAVVRLFVDHENVATNRGELQLTEYGISGIPVFQVSRYASYGISDGCKVHVNIDFMPDYGEEDIRELLSKNMKIHGDRTVYNSLCGILNSKLVSMLLAYCRIDKDRRIDTLDNNDISDILKAVKSYYSVITDTNDFEQAQVCAGGIRLTEVDDDFQSLKIPGLYITGEILDADGICGGYNLHWAWLTGMIAGRHISDNL